MSFRNIVSIRNGRLSILFIAVLFTIAVNLVFIRLAMQTPAGSRYSGIGFEAVADKLVYFAMIQQGVSGRLFMYNPHTSEPQTGLLFSPQWFGIGQVSKFFAISPEMSYHIARFFLTILFLWAFSILIRKLFDDMISRSVAYGAALFGSGMGWFYYLIHPEIQNGAVHWLAIFNRKPVDLYVTEINAFTNFVQSPLFMASYLLILAVFYLTQRSSETSSSKTNLMLFGTSCLLVLIHPYDAVVVGLVTLSFGVIRYVRSSSFRALRGSCAAVAGIAVGAGYHLWAFAREQSLSGWLAQNLAFSPHFGAYLWGLGIFVPLWLLGLYSLWRRKEHNEWWLIIILWSLAVPVSMYLPFNVNRRFTNGWGIPIAIIAAYGMISWWRSSRASVAVRTALVSLVAMMAFSGTLYSAAQYLLYAPNEQERYAYYLDEPMLESVDFAASNFRYPSVLISNEEFIAMLLAAHTTSRVYVGHPDQTIRYHLKQQQVAWFFAQPSSESAREYKFEFLKENGINYIALYRPSAGEQSWLYDAPFLKLVKQTPVLSFFSIHDPI